jgi:hypothetical protein
MHSPGGIVMVEKKKTEIVEFVQIVDDFIIMVYRNGAMHFRVVGIVDPLRVTSRTIKEQLGKDFSLPNEQKMLANLARRKVLFKTFSTIIIQPKTGRIIGIIDDRARDEITFRVIGFLDPKGIESRYKELLSQEGLEEEVRYWEYFGLGKQWVGTSMTRGEGNITLIKDCRPVTKPFLVERVF